MLVSIDCMKLKSEQKISLWRSRLIRNCLHMLCLSTNFLLSSEFFMLCSLFFLVATNDVIRFFVPARVEDSTRTTRDTCCKLSPPSDGGQRSTLSRLFNQHFFHSSLKSAEATIKGATLHN